MIELVISVSFALVVSALCSLFEAVLYAVPRTHIESLAQTGSASGRLLKGFRQEISVDRIFFRFLHFGDSDFL
jgi:CBS domain containing-hemolysin-like protein